MMNFNSSPAISLLCLVAILGATVTVNGLELTARNFDRMADGKQIFIKFYAPWCGHCKAMKDDWEKLMNKYKDHDVALVAEMDCTDDKNKGVCDEFNVDGFPTIKWGNRYSPEDYTGGREYNDFAAFAEKHVTKLTCNYLTLDACTDEQKKRISEIKKMSDEELLEIIQKVNAVKKAEEKKLEIESKELQERYQNLGSENENKLYKLREEHKFRYFDQVMKKRGLKIPKLDDKGDDNKSEGEL